MRAGGHHDAPQRSKTHLNSERYMWAVVIGTMHVLGAISSLHAIMRARTSEGAIAWLISLNTIPYLALFAYWTLGRSKFDAYVDARRDLNARLVEFTQGFERRIEPFKVAADSLTSTVIQTGAKLARTPALGKNRVDLLVNGDQTFQSVLQGIEAATDYVLVQFYTVREDRIGSELRDALLAKVKQGVRVFFLLDEIGSFELDDQYVESLRDAGVQIHQFNSSKRWVNRFQLNFRNHRKIVVVDGRWAWMGGHNVGDEYMGRNPKFGFWRDTHVRIEGPAVQWVQMSFIEDWHWSTGDVPDMNWYAEPAADGSDMQVVVIPSGPADSLETANLMFVQAINCATKRIWIASPYFVPDHSVMVALQLAGLRGVDVRILIPDQTDHLLVYLSAYTYLKDASRTGAVVCRYGKGFLHQKVHAGRRPSRGRWNSEL